MTERPVFDPVAARAELARRHLKDFIGFTKPDYEFNWHHDLICEKVDEFIKGNIRKLLIFAPPQHGKSEITTRRTPAKILGDFPQTKIAVISYAATLAEAFNRDIQRIIDDDRYHLIYPDTLLSESNVVTNVKSGFLRNTTQFETVPHRGGVRTIGVEGSLTGFTVDVAIFDDLYKSREDALSTKRRSLIESFWTSVLLPRLHNESKILGTFTRWAPDDLGGFLIKKARGWEVISIPAIKEKEQKIYYDPRPIGGALWPSRHNLIRLNEMREDAPTEFNSLYQQEPKAPTEILCIPPFNKDGKQMLFEIDEMPNAYPTFYVIDFGYSNDPFTLLRCELNTKGKMHDLYVDELIYETGVSNSKIRYFYRTLGLKGKTWADNEEPKTIDELNIKGADSEGVMCPGLNLIPAKKGPGSVMRGINKLRNVRIHYTKRSHNLKNELNNYQFIVVAGKITNDVLQNGMDHCIDPIRYGYEGFIDGAGIRIV